MSIDEIDEILKDDIIETTVANIKKDD